MAQAKNATKKKAAKKTTAKSTATSTKVKRGAAARKEEKPEKVRTQKRVSLRDQKRNIMTVSGRDPSRKYRLVNDTGDRIARFKLAGWRVEKDANLEIGDSTVMSAENADGSANKVFTNSYDGSNNPVFAYVMSIDADIYNEEQELKERARSEIENQMTEAQLEANDLEYGSIKRSRARG